jgi:succinate-semialdehyde dehydrogenase/glutarate-semialdehyde dehydrogenase
MPATTISTDALLSIDPATGATLGHVGKTSPADLPELFQRARAAQSKWQGRLISARCARLNVLRHRILESRAALADAVVRESGKPRVEALFADIFVALDSAVYFSENTKRVLRSRRVAHHSTAAKAKGGYLSYDPLGVIGIISSWNYPLAIPLSQIIPAVAAGNAVICKTSEFTPQCGDLIARLFADAGFPAGLVTIVQGGAEIGQALIDAGPDKLIFTGSVATGRRVAEACARQLIPTVLELGGKDAMIVLANADLHAASGAALWGSFTNCGQACLSVERLFVVESVAEEFVRLCVEKTKKLRLGPGSDPSTDVGPLIRPHHVQRMRELLDDAVERGAEVHCGGKARPDLGANFFEPTVVTGVNSTMKLFQEETFGPIMAIQIVKDAKEAGVRANDSPFALSASIWTRDVTYGLAMAAALRAGAVMVNDVISYFAIAEAPHGGSKLSGWGRTHGEHGLLEMVQTKYTDIDRLPRREKPWWYRYGADVEQAADAFLQFEFGGSFASRLRHAAGALKTMFRDHQLK